MRFNEYKKYVNNFEKKADFDKTKVPELLEMLQEEINTLKKGKDDKNISDHQLMDITVLILMLANRYDTDLDSEWKKHWVKSKKYLK
ncbi:hypothetical protein KJ903_00475 [Patescibacteria group bacterium]|nr:hypothetical protein [Patescibacteria group bacterium]